MPSESGGSSKAGKAKAAALRATLPKGGIRARAVQRRGGLKTAAGKAFATRQAKKQAASLKRLKRRKGGLPGTTKKGKKK